MENSQLINKIEKLIVDGQKEATDKIIMAMEKGFANVSSEFREVRKDIKDIRFQITVLDTSVKAAHYDIKELDSRLDMHLRVPHAV